ncbi:MAG: hypothetical protein K6G92_08230 [Bacteroidaceae bacterium]|nr:hypothetical protein [Bacteroidaceae bacterium]
MSVVGAAYIYSGTDNRRESPKKPRQLYRIVKHLRFPTLLLLLFVSTFCHAYYLNRYKEGRKAVLFRLKIDSDGWVKEY